MTIKRPVNQRLINLWSTMVLQEEGFIERTIPSAYNQLRAEFGYTGNRQQVMDRVAADLRRDREELAWHDSKLTTFECASPTA